MAEAIVEITEPSDLPPEIGLKCRQCRSGFLAKIFDTNGEFFCTGDLYVFDDDSMPNWIAVKVEEVRKLDGRQTDFFNTACAFDMLCGFVF